jgi:MFS family permease
MLFRFCLYGFLKNQRYFDPFLFLAFLEKGLSFTAIGLLIGFREVCINVMEIPTGAIADVLGRRRAMNFSFVSYVAAFAVFGFSTQIWMLFAAMLMFSVGEAFRTGTHKAIIFDWLAREGRADQKTRVYGFTRSWSQLGSALSVIIAAVMVFVTRDYSKVFLFSIIPYLANIVNFMGYPGYLDGPRTGSGSLGAVARMLWESFRNSFRNRSLRRLFAESMCFDGTFKVTKDYAQPILRSAAVAMPVMIGLSDRQRTAVLVGAIYMALYLASSYASRHSETLARRAGSEQRGARWIWWADLAIFGVMAVAITLSYLLADGREDAARVAPLVVAAGGFVLLSIIANFWRPIMVSRFANHADPSQTATVLSIESQGKSLFAALLAPLLGLAVDLMPGGLQFLPVGVIGVVVALLILGTSRMPTTPTQDSKDPVDGAVE